MALIAPLLALNPVLTNISTVAWKDAQAVAHFATDKMNCQTGTNYSIYGVNLYSIEVPTMISVFNDFANFFIDYPAFQSSIWVISQFPSAVAKSIPDSSTAYPYRDVTAYS